MTVEQIQCLLTYLGYNPGAVDGVNGLKTAAAVLVFQQQEGLRHILLMVMWYTKQYNMFYS